MKSKIYLIICFFICYIITLPLNYSWIISILISIFFGYILYLYLNAMDDYIKNNKIL